MIRLGVNIDHIATLREARKAREPDPVWAAGIATLAGADGITVHLRSDRRHIKERDLRILRETVTTHLNLEMAITKEMIKIAKEIKPEAVCLVPERPEEITTEGGLNVVAMQKKVKEAIPPIKSAGIQVTIFVEPDKRQIEYCAKVGSFAIEINTKAYSEARNHLEIEREIKRIKEAINLARRLNLEVHAGHGLNYYNVKEILKIPEIVELNIGYSIISRAVFVGLDRAVREMAEIVHGAMV